MTFLQKLQSEVILGDGAIGTMLQTLGLQVGECPELWNLRSPRRIARVYEQYLAAGAMVLTTNTFGGSALTLRRHNSQAQTELINQRGAEIAREMAGTTAYVAGSIGPTGEFLAPLGQITEEEMKEAFSRQAKGLEAGGVDFLQIETMTDLEELRLAVSAARETTRLPILVSMTFSRGKQGFRTVMGVSIEQMVQASESLGVDVLGTNCGNGIDEIVEIVREIRTRTSRPLFAAPNAGIPKIVAGKPHYSQNGDYFASRLPALIAEGARFISGCCGTTPDHIRKMAEKLHPPTDPN